MCKPNRSQFPRVLDTWKPKWKEDQETGTLLGENGDCISFS